MRNNQTEAQGALESQKQSILWYLGTVSGWRGRSHATDELTRRVVTWTVAALAVLCMPGYVGEARAFLSGEFAVHLTPGQLWAIAIASGLSATVLHFTIYLVAAATALAAERTLFGAVLRLPGGHRIGAFTAALALGSVLAFLPVIPFRHVPVLVLVLIATFVAIAVIVVFHSAIERMAESLRLPTMFAILGVSLLGAMAAMPLCMLFDGRIVG